MNNFAKSQKGSPRGEAGQTLIEIMLAFSVSILVLSAIVVGVTTSLSNTQYTKNQNLANSYAQEGMAVVRQIRDSSWPTFSSYSDGLYCLGPDLTELTPTSQSSLCRQKFLVDGIFAREVIFDHDSPSCCSNNSVSCENGVRGSKATVKVSWSDSKCPIGTPLCHQVELATCFSNLDQKQEP